MKRSWLLGLVLALVAAVSPAAAAAPTPTAAPTANPDPIAHDPTLIRAGG